MLVVRKEGKAHEQYNSFRSAFELLEAVGREPRDAFEDLQEGIPTVQELQQQMISMQQRNEQQMASMQQQMQQQIARMQQQIDELKADNENMKADNEKMKADNEKLRAMIKSE